MRGGAGRSVCSVAMANQTLAVELPEEIVALMGSPETAAAKAKETLVLELLREAKVSQSTAAQLLDVSRAAVLDLMAQHRIESGPETPEALAAEVDGVRRFVAEQ